MDYTKGYKAEFYSAFLDPVTWAEQERIELVSGSVSRTNSGLRASADLTVREYDQPIDRWIRIYMDCDQNGARSHEAIFTGIVSTPGSDYNGAVSTVKLTAYSPLKAAEDIKLQLGWYVPAGRNGATVIQELLRKQPAPVEIRGTAPVLSEAIVAEQNENCLTMTEKVLSAINWKVQVAGDGRIILSPVEANPEAVLLMSAGDNDIVETSFSKGRDWFSCPNVLFATTGSATYEAVDDDPDSELSTVSRGREVQVFEENVTLADNETIRKYAERRLRELQERTETASYTRRYMPEVYPDDAVSLSYSDLEGLFTIESQSITLGTSGRTKEDVKRTI